MTWHWIVIRVQDPTRLQREVDAGRGEDVDQLVDACIHAARGVDGWRWNDCD